MAAKIFGALALGTLAGLFLGERVKILEPVGVAFIALLKMPLIPYLVVSVLWGVGRLSLPDLKRLGQIAGLAILAVWSLALATVWLTGPLFPGAGPASPFASADAAVDPSGKGLIEVLIPANPFEAMAGGIIPGIVFFCFLLGYELLRDPAKANVLPLVEMSERILARMIGTLNVTLPYGVFVLMTLSAGTLSADEMRRTQLYLCLSALTAAVLALWLLPALLSALTPLRIPALYRETAGALAVAFSTGSMFASLPYTMEAAKKLAQAHAEEPARAVEGVDTVFPLAFIFPGPGTMLNLLFIPFAASLYGVPFGPQDYVRLTFLGPLSMFGGGVSGINYLLDAFQIPSDALVLFHNSMNVMQRFRVPLDAISLLSVALITVFARSRQLRLPAVPLLALGPGTLAALLAVSLGLRSLLGASTPASHLPGAAVGPMPGVRILTSPAEPLAEPLSRRLQAGGPIRAGYFPSDPPFAYTDARGRPAGYHVAMAAALAGDLDVKLDLVPSSPRTFLSDLQQGRLDLVLAPVTIDPADLGSVLFSGSYLKTRLVLVVRDDQRQEMAADRFPAGGRGLRLGYPPSDLSERSVRDLFPKATLVAAETPEIVTTGGAEAFVWSEHEGLAWARSHPEAAVVAMAGVEGERAMAIPVAPGNETFLNALDAWLAAHQADGLLERLYKTWISGTQAPPRARRWNILDDVLGGGS